MSPRTTVKPPDPAELAIFKGAVHAIAEEMGAALRRTGFSANIKERRDYSCALFAASGEIIAMGDHMPVHLGAMPLSLRAAIRSLAFSRGDVAALNDPYAGGSHLPDITLVHPIFLGRGSRPAFYVANRAHHADIGGTYPGSMGVCREIYQEGLRIPPVKLVERGRVRRDLMNLILNNVRSPAEREGDLTAQIGSCRLGAVRLRELVKKYGFARVNRNVRALLDYSERLMRAELARLPQGEFQAEDHLDEDGVSCRPVRITLRLTTDPRRGRAAVDFSGTDVQVAGGVNAVFAITYSAVFYVFRCLLSEDAPATARLMRPIEIRAPEGTVVNARAPAPVAAGNVETSQRITDVMMKALAQAIPERVPAASAGTMNNVTAGGLDPRTGRPFTYYETIAGGMGARPDRDGVSGVHTHMTNSLNTPAEALEYQYPLRVRRYAFRSGSGGRGRFRGGDGLIREIEFLGPATLSLLGDRRVFPPYGLAGGASGARGRASLVRANGHIEKLPGKCNVEAQPGDILRIETPGGGGWGKPG